MSYLKPTKILFASSLTALVINWPLASMIWSPEKHPVQYWMYTLCIILTIYTPYALILRNLTMEWRNRYIYSLLNTFGVPLLVGFTVFAFAKVCEQYFIYENVPYYGKSLYICILAIISPTLLIVEYYIGMIYTVSLYSDWVNFPAKCEKYASLIIWSGLAFAYYLVSQTLLTAEPKDSLQCADIMS